MNTANSIKHIRFGNLLAIGSIVLFTLIGIVRLYPFNVGVDAYISQGIVTVWDDWYSYASFGRDIAQNGLLLPAVKGPYAGPSGFLYAYFIAFFLKISGGNISLVFLSQYVLTGVAVAFMYWTYGSKMSKNVGMLFLVGLVLFTLVDVSKNYSGTLLSENLAFYIMPMFFYCFIKGYEKNKKWFCLVSAFLLGLAFLTRPNILLFPILLIVASVGFYVRKWKIRGAWLLLLFTLIFLLTSSLLGLRNYLVCGKWVFLPEIVLKDSNTPMPHTFDPALMVTDPFYARLHKLGLDENQLIFVDFLRKKPVLFFTNYVKRALFCFGFTPLFVSKYRVRFHWIAMWTVYFIYLFTRLRRKKKFELWELSTHLFIFSYFGTLLIFSYISNYGFRYLIPAINFVLVFVFMEFDRLHMDMP